MACNKIYRVEAVGLSFSKYSFKITIFEYVKFWVISWKKNILSVIT